LGWRGIVKGKKGGRGINRVSEKKELHPTRCNSLYCLVELRGSNPWSLECHHGVTEQAKNQYYSSFSVSLGQIFFLG